MDRLIARTMWLVVIAGCSAATDIETSSNGEPSTTLALFAETTTTVSVQQSSTTAGSAPEPMAFEEPEVVVFEHQEPTSPETPGCVAANALLFDPAFQSSDDRAREAALIAATNDILDGAEEAWLAIRDKIPAEEDDPETRFRDMKAAADSANQLNRITWESCGIPILQVDQMLTTSGCFASRGCVEPDIWAEVIPCFQMQRFTIVMIADISIDQEGYLPVDCLTTEPIELDRDGTWRAKRTQEELARLTVAWVVDSTITAGTPSAQAIEEGLLVQQEIDIDLYDPLMIVDPAIELQGLVAGEDLSNGHFLVSGDFIVP